MALALFGTSKDPPWEYALTQYTGTYLATHSTEVMTEWLTKGEIETRHGKEKARLLIEAGYFETQEVGDGVDLFRRRRLIESVSKQHIRAQTITKRAAAAESECSQILAMVRERNQNNLSFAGEDSSSDDVEAASTRRWQRGGR